ncbi:uncharacterized protein K452DRAFT_218179 [Aplosporella prunicola CBS 121167]|uniref:Serine hydrolase domain-containing protein n=1 Tax=Aplosporella prunicola CBS 121167 TaxID=1176127 RepID=A0A6A6BTI9_9PEZI|nr:uncharacterized protein K452DRAFT_218179 [Aplosporella prunicola CBS 121167]KAF2146585.1 hypothetical protein K452DRAFT_218179 [Aplosporella prunicola CBS 121167]
MAAFATTSDPTFQLPRLLCLHGGGVTAEVFRLQARAFVSALSPYFRLVFADGPFFCDAGPGVLPVYADLGPYRRWLRWQPHHLDVDSETTVEEIRYQLELAMEEDDRRGAVGEWAGFLGFSQGGKLAASLLFEAQKRRERREGKIDGEETMLWKQNWRFAVCMAARAPLVALSPGSEKISSFVSAGGVSEGFDFEAAGKPGPEALLRAPTLHIHGLKDPGLHLHQILLDAYCAPGSATLVEWDGDHRVPLKAKDMEGITRAILETAKKGGVEPGKKQDLET